MKLAQKVAAGLGFARVRLLGERRPVAVRLNLNNRCHSRCAYCSFWHTPTEEMSTGEWKTIIADLGALGARRLSLSGGEPMLRKDLGEIAKAAVDHGMSVGLNSTGFLFDKRPEDLAHVDLVKLSLDGPRDVHDTIRGRPGAFDEMLAGIDVLNDLGIPYSFALTVTRHNVDHVMWAVDFAEQHGTFIAVQPVMAVTHASEDVDTTFPDPKAYDRMIDALVARKKRTPTALRNSKYGIEHIRSWPRITGLECYSGEAFVMVEPNGDVVPCDRIEYGDPIPNCRERGIAWALDNLPRVRCEGCGFCGSVEINMIMAGRLDALGSIRRVVDRRSEHRPNAAATRPKRTRLPVVQDG